MELFIFWIIAAAGVGAIASARERSGFGWFLGAVLLSPLIAVIIVLVLPNRRQERLARDRHQEMLHAVNPEYQTQPDGIHPLLRTTERTGRPRLFNSTSPIAAVTAIAIILLIVYFTKHG